MTVWWVALLISHICYALFGKPIIIVLVLALAFGLRLLIVQANSCLHWPGASFVSAGDLRSMYHDEGI